MNDMQEIINSGIIRYLESDRKSWAQHTHRASSIGHPCQRYLYYSIHDWEKAPPPENSMLGIFKTGTVLEDKLVGIFNENIGPSCVPPLRIVKTQTVIRDKLLEKYKITGTCDGVLQWCVEGKWSDLGIVDIKTCSANLFASYNNLESLKRHTWSTMYPAQVMTYAFASDYERGFLLFVSKGNIFYDWKIIEVPVDMEQVEGLLTKCEAVNKSLDAGTEPVRINRPFWCADCKWQSLCLPEFTYNGSGPVMNEDKEVERIVNRLQEIKPHWSEYEELKKTLRKSLCEGQPLILENAMIDWKRIHGQRQPSPGGPFEYWKMTITSTNDDDDDE